DHADPLGSARRRQQTQSRQRRAAAPPDRLRPDPPARPRGRDRFVLTAGSVTIPRVTNLRRSIGAFAICTLSHLASCGGSGGGGLGSGGGGKSNFRATIDGQSWIADANAVQVSADAKAPGVLALTGTHVTSASNYLSLELALGYLTGPKTYPLGVNAGTNAGGRATVFEQQGST